MENPNYKWMITYDNWGYSPFQTSSDHLRIPRFMVALLGPDVIDRRQVVPVCAAFLCDTAIAAIADRQHTSENLHSGYLYNIAMERSTHF